MEKMTLTLQNLIQNDVNIFDFYYPFYNEEYRKTFEQHFVDNFLFDEIGQETVARFKHRLKVKLNLIMPYWNKILLADNMEQRILNSYDVTEKYIREVNSNTKQVNQGNINSSNENVNKVLENDTPINKIDIEVNDYVSNITKSNASNINNTNSNNTNNVENLNNENWTRTMQGSIGIQTDSDAITKYWKSLRQLEMEIFEQCNDLFMEVY